MLPYVAYFLLSNAKTTHAKLPRNRGTVQAVVMYGMIFVVVAAFVWYAVRVLTNYA